MKNEISVQDNNIYCVCEEQDVKITLITNFQDAPLKMFFPESEFKGEDTKGLKRCDIVCMPSSSSNSQYYIELKVSLNFGRNTHVTRQLKDTINYYQDKLPPNPKVLEAYVVYIKEGKDSPQNLPFSNTEEQAAKSEIKEEYGVVPQYVKSPFCLKVT